MERTISQSVFDGIEEKLKKSHIDGVIVIKKSGSTERPNNLMKGVVDYLQRRGYDTISREDDEEYHISLVLRRL